MGADAVVVAEGNIAAGEMPSRPWSHRGRRAGRAREGFPGTWEILMPPRERYRRSETNEERRDGQEEVGASRSTGEAGEADRATPWREGDAG